jgi:amino acid adenylation domain-containing protein
MLQTNVLEYLEGTAARFPDKPAFVDEGECFTFARLLSCARGLGCALAGLTPRRNAPVAVLVERSAAAVAAFQGVLCSGNFYVPLDSQMPLARMESILTTLSPAALVYPRALEGTARALAAFCPILCQEEGFAHPVQADLLAACRAGVLDTDPVYGIFTSGSTGTPKGIVCHHRGVIDLAEWLAEAGRFTEEDVLGNQAPFYFDGSVKDLYMTLKCGATCHILPKKLFMFPKLLVEKLDQEGVTTLAWATSAFHLVAASGVLEQYRPSHLTKVLAGGEAMLARDLNIWRRALPQVRYINLYGPTETTVDAAWYEVDRDFADGEPIPIGLPCRNKEILLLDEGLRPVTDGQIGELCIRGLGLAKGYFGDWDKTRGAFVQDPRNPYYPDLIYRTGDLALRGADGLLYFSTRRDGQIKHMGYRIELGEIETALSGIPGLDEVACLFDQERDKLLCAYTGGEDPKQLAKAARDLLPRYMVPNAYHHLEEMPHNANGKIHRVKLREELLHETN